MENTNSSVIDILEAGQVHKEHKTSTGEGASIDTTGNQILMSIEVDESTELEKITDQIKFESSDENDKISQADFSNIPNAEDISSRSETIDSPISDEEKENKDLAIPDVVEEETDVKDGANDMDAIVLGTGTNKCFDGTPVTVQCEGSMICSGELEKEVLPVCEFINNNSIEEKQDNGVLSIPLAKESRLFFLQLDRKTKSQQVSTPSAASVMQTSHIPQYRSINLNNDHVAEEFEVSCDWKNCRTQELPAPPKNEGNEQEMSLSTKDLRSIFEAKAQNSSKQFCANPLPGPSRAYQMFTGNMNLCKVCNKVVYQMEKVDAGKEIYHRNCFRCSSCKTLLTMSSYTLANDVLLCRTHYIRMFKEKGSYEGEMN